VTLAGTYPNGLDGAVLKFTAPNTFTVFASGLNNARSIAVDSEANVYVVENNAAGDIRRYTAPGSYTVFAAPFSYPYGVGVDEEDTVWIADASNLYTATAPQGQTVYASGLFYPTQFGFRVGLKHSKECKDR
jgi:streptogramin lyase